MEILFNKLINHYTKDFKISAESISLISKHLEIVEYKKKKTLIHEGKRHNFAYFILEGCCRSFYLKDGIQVNNWFAIENEMVGYLQNLNNEPSYEAVECLEDVKLIAINLSQLKTLMTQEIAVANIANSIINEYALFAEEKNYNLQMMSAEEKYLTLLKKEPQILNRVSLTHISSYLGVSRETLSRLRSKRIL